MTCVRFADENMSFWGLKGHRTLCRSRERLMEEFSASIAVYRCFAEDGILFSSLERCSMTGCR